MVSPLARTHFLTIANKFASARIQYNLGNRKIPLEAPPTSHVQKLPPIIEEPAVALGDTVSNSSTTLVTLASDSLKTLVNRTRAVSSPLQLPNFKCPLNSSPPYAHPSENNISDNFSAVSRASSAYSTRPPKPPLPSPDNPSNDNSSAEDYSSSSSPGSPSCGSNADADAEMDMYMETEMEWEDLKNDIKKEVEEAIKEEEEIDGKDADKENQVPPNKLVSSDIYNRLYASYTQVTGEAPSEATMEQLQKSYIILLERNIVPFTPRKKPNPSFNELIKSAVNPPYVKSPNIHFPFGNSKHTPATSSPLANNPPYPFIPPESAVVYMMQDASSEDGGVTLKDSRDTPSPEFFDSKDATDKPDHDVLDPTSSDIDISSPNDEMTESTIPEDSATQPSEDLLTVTVPSSPVPMEEGLERMNRFQRPRKVGKDELIASLQYEVEHMREEMKLLDASDIALNQNYMERLTETLEKIKKMEAERVGELSVKQLYLAGLIYILWLTE